MTRKMTVPLKITCKLLDGRVDSADKFFFFDAIIYHAWFKKHHPETFEGTAKKWQDFPIGLPLSKNDSGIYHASMGFYHEYDYNTEYWNKVTNAAEKSGQEYVNFGGKTTINTTAGEYKRYRMPQIIRVIGDVTFYACGRKEVVEELLSLIPYIGKKGSIGWGWVKEWIVEEIDEDKSFVCEHGISRPKKMDGSLDGQGYQVMNIRVSPPYWANGNKEICYIPKVMI